MAGPYYFDVTASPYNAVGDGSTDNTAAIQAAINDASSTTGTVLVGNSANHGSPSNSTVLIPAGQYRVSQLNLKSGVTLQGVGGGSYGVTGGNMDAPGWGTSVLEQIGGSNKHMILVNDTANYQRIFDLALDGNKGNNSSGDVIHISDGASGQESQVIMERVFIFNSPGNGIYLGHNRRANKVLKSVINYSAADGIMVAGSDNTIQNCILGSNVRANICLGNNTGVHWAGSGTSAAAVTHVLNNDIYGNTNSPYTQVGIALCLGSWGSVIMENGIDRHQLEGISVYDGSTTIINGNVFHSNGIVTNNTYGHIGLGTNVSSVSIDCNSFGPLDGGITNKANYGVYNQSSGGAGAVVGSYGVLYPGSTGGSLNNGLHN